jgi:HEAT repeat protein
MRNSHILKVFIFLGLASIAGLGALLGEEPRTREEQKLAVWIDQLADKGPKAREGAALSLEDFAGRNVILSANETQIKKLLQALDGPDPKVKVGTLAFLRRLGGKEIVEKVKLKLQDEDAEVRAEAAAALIDLRPLGDIGPLIAAAQDQNERVRGAVASALGNSKYPEAYQVLLRLSQDESDDVRYSALSALEDYGDKRAEPLLIALLNDPNPQIRWGAAHALYYVGGKNSVGPLIEVLGKKDLYVSGESLHETVNSSLREITMTASEQHGYEWWNNWWKEHKDSFDPVGRLREWLRSEVSENDWALAVRKIELHKMKELKADLRTSMLSEKGSRKDKSRALLSALILAEWGELEGLAYLFSALKDTHPKTESFPIYYLRKLTGQFFCGDPEAWLNWWEENKSSIRWNEKHHIFEAVEQESG